MDPWKLLTEILIALGAATLLGAIFERIKIGAVVGYIVGGIVVGPGALGLVNESKTILGLAELGICLLLFSTGLEFSFLRLKKLGRNTVLAGIFQILFCMAFFTGLGMAFGFSWRTSLAVSSAIAVSSTAIVLRVLKERSELDSNHGRTAFGILLIQDIALVPLVLFVTLLGNDQQMNIGSENILPRLGSFALAAFCFWFLIAKVFPRFLRSSTIALSRELPVLIAILSCAGAALVAHNFGISAALGAFIAGVLLAETSLETQIRADIAPLRILFGTVFFASIGMLADLSWMGKNAGMLISATVLVIIGKTLMNFAAIRAFKSSTISSAAAAISLAQIGELSFILLQIGVLGKIIPNDLSQLITGVVVISMIFSPGMLSIAPKISRWLVIKLVNVKKLAKEELQEREAAFAKHFVVIGFGTAGKTAAQILTNAQYTVVAVDLNPRASKWVREVGAVSKIGDATHIDFLEELHLPDARALIVALPDPRSASLVTSLARKIAPDLAIIVRSRSRMFAEEIRNSGATMIISEEQLLGQRMGEEAVDLAIGQYDKDVREQDPAFAH